MKEFFSNPQLRRQLVTRLLEVGGLVLVVTICWLAYAQVQERRIAMLQKEAELAAEPQQLLGVSKVQGELRAREHDVDRILKLVTDPNDIVGFIENIEEAATDYDISLAVSSIEEAQDMNEAGQPVEPTGPFRSIRLIITGQGTAADLLEYVHTLEHEQRLLTLATWDIAVDATSPAAASQFSTGRAVDDDSVVASPAASAELQAELILLVHNEKYSVQ